MLDKIGVLGSRVACPGELQPLQFRRAAFAFQTPVIVATVNTTPDSFSDGGRFANAKGQLDDDALRRYAEATLAAGVCVFDVGGESTRPPQVGAPYRAVSAQEELERIGPALELLRREFDATLSVDTTKAEVAKAAVELGADIINDISGGLFDGGMWQVAVASGALYIAGHVRGETLSQVHAGPGVASLEEVRDDLQKLLRRMPLALAERTIVDPCLGFGKGRELNLELTRRVCELRRGVGRPVMIGSSRKRFLGEITGRGAAERDAASVGAALAAMVAGADFVRVHDAVAVCDAWRVWRATFEVARD